MKKILFAIAIVTFACTFVSCDADSVDDGLSTMNADDTGGPGGSGATTPITPPPPPPSTPPKNPGAQLRINN